MRSTIRRILCVGIILFFSLCLHVGGCHKKLVNGDKVGVVKGFVKDSVSLIPIAGVDVFLDDEPYVYFPTTDSLGYYRVGLLLAGPRLVKITMKSQGYEPQDKNVTLQPNQTQRLDFLLVKDGGS